MTQPNSIQLTIPRPCTQNWEEMTPAQQGRFCAHCQKTVINFSEWSDTALYNFFSKNTEQVCGRLLETQIERNINISYQPHSKLYRIAIALGLTLMFTQTPQLLAQNRPPKTDQTSVLKQPDSTGRQFGSISGKVIDEKKEPLISAAIQIYRDEILIGGNITDIDGNYSINMLEPGTYDVVALYAGYDSVKTQVNILAEHITKLDFSASRKKNCTIMGMFTVQYAVPLKDVNNPTKRTITREEINQMPH